MTSFTDLHVGQELAELGVIQNSLLDVRGSDALLTFECHLLEGNDEKFFGNEFADSCGNDSSIAREALSNSSLSEHTSEACDGEKQVSSG